MCHAGHHRHVYVLVVAGSVLVGDFQVDGASVTVCRLGGRGDRGSTSGGVRGGAPPIGCGLHVYGSDFFRLVGGSNGGGLPCNDGVVCWVCHIKAVGVALGDCDFTLHVIRGAVTVGDFH